MMIAISRKRRGQATPVALIMTFLLLILAVSFYPALNEAIQSVWDELSPMEQFIVSIFFVLIIIMIVISFLYHVIPRREVYMPPPY